MESKRWRYNVNSSLSGSPRGTFGGNHPACTSAYSKRVPRTNCALRIKKCAPRISTKSREYNARNSLSRRSNITKIVVRWGFAPDPTGGAYSAPHSWIQRALLLRLLLLRGGEGREGRGGPRKIVHPEKFLRIGPGLH